MSISRRDLVLQAGACLCATRAARSEGGVAACVCNPPEVLEGALIFEDSCVVVDLAAAGVLGRPGKAAVIWNEPREVRLLLVRSGDGEYLAFSAKCTHANGRLGYDPARETLWCTSFSHSTFGLNGAVTKGPAQKALAFYPCVESAGKLTVSL